MFRRLTLLSLALPLAATLTACATPRPPIQLPPGVKTVLQYPPKPSPEALACPPEPVAPEALTKEGARDTDVLLYLEEVLRVSSDCRGKLGVIRDWIGTWPDN